MKGTTSKAVEDVDLSMLKDIEHGNIVELGDGISFQKIVYAHLIEEDSEVKTKATVSNNNLSLVRELCFEVESIHLLLIYRGLFTNKVPAMQTVFLSGFLESSVQT